MSKPKLKEVFLYGNLTNCYSHIEIKNISLKEIEEIIKDANFKDLGKKWFWRIHYNIHKLYTTNIFYQENVKAIYNIYRILLDNCMKDNILDMEEIELSEGKLKTIKDECKIALFSLLNEFFLNSNSVINDEINEFFIETFDKYILFIRNNFFKADYNLPKHREIWTSKWFITYNENVIDIEAIDVYTDIIFSVHNMKYNYIMKNDIINITRRLNFIKENSPMYYDCCIRDKISKISELIFYSFPYPIIYQQYLDLIKSNNEVYVPEILKCLDLENINNYIWLFSILPIYLTSYLLGFPIISCDIPSIKNIKSKIIEIMENDINYYYNNVSENNKCYIKSISMGIECANHEENGEILDLTYNKVIDYNMDDILLFFNSGVCHIFTAPEFDNLLSKEINPYNRNNIPITANMLNNIKFKKKIKRQLSNRQINIELNNPMKENLEIIKEEMEKQNIETTYEQNNIITKLQQELLNLLTRNLI
jgi:hypothetical protein